MLRSSLRSARVWLVLGVALSPGVGYAQESEKKAESDGALSAALDALQEKGPGPGPGAGQRHIEQSGAVRSAASSDEAKPEATHRKGKPPQQPNATLPPGVERAQTDEGARRQVAGGPTSDDIAAGTDDAELRELRDVERVLFARSLKGLRPGWSWELPARVDDGSPSVTASGLPLSTAPPAAAEERLELGAETAWIKKLSMPDLPVRLDARVVKYLQFYRDDPRGRRIARVWAKKSGRLTPALKAAFARAGLPTDLAWISLIESGHNPLAFSPAAAAGLWQFMPESARMYGLTVDRWVDERLDPERSTDAAVRYLQDLRARFGNWELAMASYNMGHGGLLRAMRKFNTNDFWVLARHEAGVPWETTLYVPKILAIAIVMNNKHAFRIDDIEPDPPISFDTVYVDQGKPLEEVARAAQVPVEDVTALNVHYLAGKTPLSGAKKWPVRVPSGRGLFTSQSLAKSSGGTKGDVARYIVRFGDTLGAIAREHDTSDKELRRINGFGAGVGLDEALVEGAVILVPRATAKQPATEDVVAVVPERRFDYPDRRRLFYRVLTGDTLASIAAAFSVSPSEAAAWNVLDPSARLQAEMTLQLFVPKDADLSRVRYLEEGRVRVLTAGTDDFFDYFEAQAGRKRIAVAAKEGDTLATIGKRYGMSSGMMERINRFSRSKKLRAGENVIVYTKRGTAGESLVQAGAPAPLPPVDAPHPESLPHAPSEGAAVPSGDKRAVLP